MTEYEEAPGVRSMMRVGVDRASRAGAALIAASIATVPIAAIYGYAWLGTAAAAMAASGAGVISAALGAKGWQAQAEGRVS